MSLRRALAATAAACAFAAAGPVPAAHAGQCPGAAQAAPAAATTASARSAVRCLVNAERSARGLPALRSSGSLRSAAMAFSAQMVARRFFDHVSPGGATLSDRARHAGYPGPTLGEAIGWGTLELATPAAIVRAWMNSPPHRAVILHRRVRDIGVGVAIGTPAGSAANGAVYVLDVGRR